MYKAALRLDRCCRPSPGSILTHWAPSPRDEKLQVHRGRPPAVRRELVNASFRKAGWDSEPLSSVLWKYHGLTRTSPIGGTSRPSCQWPQVSLAAPPVARARGCTDALPTPGTGPDLAAERTAGCGEVEIGTAEQQTGSFSSIMRDTPGAERTVTAGCGDSPRPGGWAPRNRDGRAANRVAAAARPFLILPIGGPVAVSLGYLWKAAFGACRCHGLASHGTQLLRLTA
jgi:hypothetical protein